MPRQTLERAVELAGTGLHTGCEVAVTCRPAPSGFGIAFRRVDLDPPSVIPATLDWVSATTRRTRLGRNNTTVETVEHLLASVQAYGLDDLLVDLDGPELPIFDGSFSPWVEALEWGGRATHGGEPDRWGLAEPLEVHDADSSYHVAPCEGLALEVTIEWPHPLIGRQTAALELSGASFRREVADARTFGFASEVGQLREAGLLRGATPACAVVLSEHGILEGAVRWPNEFARHKLGDLVGDLALLGGRVQARITALRPSHRGNVALARAIARQAQPEGEG